MMHWSVKKKRDTYTKWQSLPLPVCHVCHDFTATHGLEERQERGDTKGGGNDRECSSSDVADVLIGMIAIS